MNPYLVAAAVALLVLVGAAIGGWLRERLPRHHLDDESREMVKVGIGFLSTLAALVLGLLISSAKDSFDTVSKHVESTATEILQLDGNLRELGAAGEPARELLRRVLARTLAELWGDGAEVQGQSTSAGAAGIFELQKILRALSPADAAGASARARALQLSEQLVQVHAATLAHRASSISFPLLAVLVFWLMIISLGQNLLSPTHGTIHAINVLCALSIAGAILLTLEMDQPYGGLVRVSDAPLRAALQQLDR